MLGAQALRDPGRLRQELMLYHTSCGTSPTCENPVGTRTP
jgi:hypothetical protein